MFTKKKIMLIAPGVVFLTLSLLAFPALYFVFGLNQTAHDFSECVYFSVITMTTTGYGDVVPQGVGRVFACLEIFCGVGILSVWFSIAISFFLA